MGWPLSARRVVVALALAACHHAPRPYPGYHATALALPAADPSAVPSDFAACKGALAIVPHQGGVIAAGWRSWLVHPAATPIESVACDEAGDLFLIANHELVMTSPQGLHTTTALPDGAWHVVGTADPAVWVHGVGADGASAIYHVVPGQDPEPLYQGPAKVQAIAPIGTTGLVAAIDGEIYAWRDRDPEDLGHVGDIDGLAVGPEGALYVSGPGGVAKLRSLDTNPERVTTAMHGPLQVRGGTLYILWRAEDTVVRLDPVMITPPEPRHSGPAYDRRQSMDLGIDLITASQRDPMTLRFAGDTVAYRDPLTLYGMGLKLDLGPELSKRLVFEMQFAFLGGSGPAGGAGDVGIFTSMFNIRLGRRIPFNVTSVRFGSGIEGGMSNASLSPTKSVVSFDPYIPLWVRYEWEPTCKVGLFAGASYDYGLTSPSMLTFVVGGDLRVDRRCW